MQVGTVGLLASKDSVVPETNRLVGRREPFAVGRFGEETVGSFSADATGVFKGEANIAFPTGAGGLGGSRTSTARGRGATGCMAGQVLRERRWLRLKGLAHRWVLEIGSHGVRTCCCRVVWLAEHAHGALDGLETFVLLFVLDTVPDEPLELVWLKIIEFVHVSSANADVIQEIELEFVFEIISSEEVVGMFTPSVCNVSCIRAWKMSFYYVTHTEACFTPAGGIHQMLSRRVGKN